jgi:multidrug efflux pump subunit AcrA (membrane-fusion protein)
MKRMIALTAVFVTGVAAGLILSYGALSAQNAGEGDILARLDDISKQQQQLIGVVNSIKEDVAVIKVRVTQMQ